MAQAMMVQSRPTPYADSDDSDSASSEESAESTEAPAVPAPRPRFQPSERRRPVPRVKKSETGECVTCHHCRSIAAKQHTLRCVLGAQCHRKYKTDGGVWCARCAIMHFKMAHLADEEPGFAVYRDALYARGFTPEAIAAAIEALRRQDGTDAVATLPCPACIGLPCAQTGFVCSKGKRHRCAYGTGAEPHVTQFTLSRVDPAWEHAAWWETTRDMHPEERMRRLFALHPDGAVVRIPRVTIVNTPTVWAAQSHAICTAYFPSWTQTFKGRRTGLAGRKRRQPAAELFSDAGDSESEGGDGGVGEGWFSAANREACRTVVSILRRADARAHRMYKRCEKKLGELRKSVEGSAAAR